MQDYPFAPESFAADCMLPDAADYLIRDNKGHSADKEGDPLCNNRYLLIGSDGGEEEYLLDLQQNPSPVYKFDLETGQFAVFANDLHAYVRRCFEVDEEIEAEEREAEEERKWWRFWR